MSLFKKRSPTAYSELLDVCGVLGEAIGMCSVGQRPGDYLDFTIQNQAADFHTRYEAYATEQGSIDKAWSESEKHIGMIAKIWLDTNNIHTDKKRLAERVNEVMMAMMAASAGQAAETLTDP